MTLASKDIDQTRIIHVGCSRIDAALAIQFKEDMRQITQDAPKRVILDLTQVEFIDSSGLGAIVAAMKQLGDASRMDLAGLSETVSKVFRLTRMDTVFQLYPTLDDAIGEQAH